MRCCLEKSTWRLERLLEGFERPIGVLVVLGVPIGALIALGGPPVWDRLFGPSGAIDSRSPGCVLLVSINLLIES